MRYTLDSLFQIKGRSIVIPGGASGIGLEIACALADLGANVAVIGRTPAKCEKAEALLKSRNPSARAFVANVQSQEEIRAAFQKAAEDFGTIDGLVYSAGINHIEELETQPDADFDDVMNTNFKPDLIICGCSSIGETVYHAQKVIDIPIIRIDEAMAREAVSKYHRIGVMATLSTTLDPTCNLILNIAKEEGKQVELNKMVAAGAFEETMAGHIDKAEEIMRDTFIKLADTNDCVLFAQASMAELKDNMLKYRDVPILCSPEFCALQVKAMFEGQ